MLGMLIGRSCAVDRQREGGNVVVGQGARSAFCVLCHLGSRMKNPAWRWVCYKTSMSIDELARISGSAIGVSLYSLAIEKAGRHLSARRKKVGHSLLYPVGKKAGELGARAYKEIKCSLRRGRV